MTILHRVVVATALACVALAPAAARAGALSDNVAAIQLSTLGYGVSIGHTIAPRVDLRLATGALSYGHNVTSDGVNYSGTLQLHNISALVDVHPLNGPFRITGGLVFGNDHVDVVGNAQNGSYTINGNTYSAAQAGTIYGTAKLSSGAPYIGVGMGPPHRLGVYFTGDVGVVFRSVKTSLYATGPAAATPQLQSDLASARNTFANDVGWLKTYPVVSVGIATRF